jgi:hypothetical protein
VCPLITIPENKFIQKNIDNYCHLLDRDGYVVVPNVLNPQEVQFLRQFFLEKFKNPEKYFEGNDYFEAIFEIFERYEELSWLLFREPAISIVRQLLGNDFVLLRGTSVSYNRYGWWWHKDTSNEERAGHKYHLAPEYRRLIVSYYLQDNHPRYGGGLDVEPGSHHWSDPGFQYPTMIEKKDPFWKRWLGLSSLEKKMVPDYNDHLVKKRYSIPHKAGDLIIFDVKINHRATQKKVDQIPIAHEKLAIYTHFSRNNKTVQESNYFTDSAFKHSMAQREYPSTVKVQAEKIGMNFS